MSLPGPLGRAGVVVAALMALARHVQALNGAMQGAALHRQQRDGAAWFTEWLSLSAMVMGAAARQGAHPRLELGHGEGFDQVIVGPGIQPFNPVMGFGPRGQEQHGPAVAARTHRTQQRKPIASRQVDVENHHVPTIPGEEFIPGQAIGNHIHGMAEILQPVGDSARKTLIILYKNDSHVPPVSFCRESFTQGWQGMLPPSSRDAG